MPVKGENQKSWEMVCPNFIKALMPHGGYGNKQLELASFRTCGTSFQSESQIARLDP
jgi:hypothetical protein